MNSFLEQPPQEEILKSPWKSVAEDFLSEAEGFISEETLAHIIEKSKVTEEKVRKDMDSGNYSQTAMYDKYKKSFFVGNEHATIGEIVAARHMGININLPENLEISGDGKKIRRLMVEHRTNDVLYESLNKELASVLAETVRREDILKSKAYEAIALRSGTESAHIGVVAEHIMIGLAEKISIDRPDLGMRVLPANAYQDVEEKIDFIIATSHKKRGAQIDSKELSEEDRVIGIQFTVNTPKKEHKLEQIAKSKERGVHVDDIVYVAIEKEVLQKAIKEWEKAGKPIAGPWSYLSKDIQHLTLRGLFGGVLTEEQERSLLK